MRVFRIHSVSGAVCAVAGAVTACAQVGQNGSLTGGVTAVDRLAIAAGTVTLLSADGLQRTTTTDAYGRFAIRDLPSGSYQVEVVAKGFQPTVRTGIAVAVGRTTELSFALPPAGIQESVSVSAQTASVDAGQTSSVVNVDRDRVEELPIPNRNYLTFVLLSPQAAPANPALSQGTLSQGNGGFSFGGLRPGSNAVQLDGVDDDDEFSGGTRTQLSPEAINDFQIVNHGFAAESGGAAGGSIDVQTRSGRNRTHGDAFLFVQNGALNGTQHLRPLTQRPDESRVRGGVSLGGAVQPDRTFYFMAAEQELARGEDASDLSPATVAAINKALQATGPSRGVPVQSGFFPTTDQELEVSGRLDRVLTARHTATLRYALTNTRNVNDAFHTSELTDRSARGSSFTVDNSLNGSLSSTLTRSVVNRFNFEISQRRAVERTAGLTAGVGGPGVFVAGVALFGTPYEGNSRRFETHLEAEDHTLVQRGQHLLQVGGGLNHVGMRVAVADGLRGFYAFPDLASFTTGQADFYTQNFGSPAVKFAENRVKGYVQDHWTPGRGVTLDVGLRYELNRLPSPLPVDAVNLSPRIGAAWSPTPNWVVRSGFGVFYDRFQLSTVDRLFRLDGTRGFQRVLEGDAAAALYRSGRAGLQPMPGVAPSVWRAQPDLRNPYSEVASVSVERALPLQTTLTAEYQYVHGVRLGRSRNINLLPPALLTAGNAAALGVSTPTAQQLDRPVFGPARVDKRFGAVNQLESGAASVYHGATITLNRQFQDDLQVLAGYSFSKTVDDASFDGEQPQNPFDPRAERALSLQDQRHRFTLSGLWLLGPDLADAADALKNANPGRVMRLLTGLEFAPIASITSGYRANPIVGIDSNREGTYPFSARPAGFGRNSLGTKPTINLDLRVLKIIPFEAGRLDVVAESFNLLNHQNVSLLNGAYGTGAQAMPGFAAPIGTGQARRIQFSLDWEF